ncbi:MAG: Crp/Fnr family transcriptional regulator [Deltaproteobacteria bacterium]|nr:Crp/Fnr family transcriptional regulator [Deltaproteobacteria bacterium]
MAEVTTIMQAKDCKTCQSRLMGMFCALDDPALSELNRGKTTNMYKKGQIIFYEGNRAYGLYCILAGRVKLYKTGIDGRHQIVRIADPGDLLGYRSLFADEPYTATAESLEDSTICCIDKNTFFPVLAKHPELAMNVIKKLSAELRAAEDLATSIAQKSVRERMAELLLMLKEAYGKATKAGGISISLELTRQEMGEMIGVTPETAIRLLSEFKKDGIIDVDERHITITNTKKLLDTARIDI